MPIRTPEDHYNGAVALINSGRLEEAEQHLNRALKLTPRADHVYYALSAVQSLRRGHRGGAGKFANRQLTWNLATGIWPAMTGISPR